MEFLGHMPVFFWVMLVLMIIGGIYQLVVGQATHRDMEEAASLAHSDRWQESATIYRKLVLERLAFPDKAMEAAEKLGALYREHGVDVQLTDLQQSMALLRDIEAASVSDRRKVQMRAELGAKLRPILNSLPPVVETPESEPTMAEPGDGGGPERVEEACRYCNEMVSGNAWTFDQYVANEQLVSRDILGYGCPACGALSHKDCPSGIVYKIWSGYDKSLCAACGQPVQEPTVIFPG